MVNTDCGCAQRFNSHWIFYGTLDSGLGFESQRCLVMHPADLLERLASVRIWFCDSSVRITIVSHFTNILWGVLNFLKVTRHSADGA